MCSFRFFYALKTDQRERVPNQPNGAGSGFCVAKTLTRSLQADKKPLSPQAGIVGISG